MICHDTFEHALQDFLCWMRHEAKMGREVSRRYQAEGAVVKFTKYWGVHMTFPRAQWISHPPKRFEGVKMRDYIKQYMTPYAIQPPPKPKPKIIKNVMRAKAPMDHGVIVHQTDTNHYAQLLRKLQCTQINYGEDDEQ